MKHHLRAIHTHHDSLTDRGWAAMKPVLDRQLPNRRRKRPVAAWFWSLPALLLIYSSIQHQTVTPPANSIVMAEQKPLTTQNTDLVAHVVTKSQTVSPSSNTPPSVDHPTPLSGLTLHSENADQSDFIEQEINIFQQPEPVELRSETRAEIPQSVEFLAALPSISVAPQTSQKQTFNPKQFAGALQTPVLPIHKFKKKTPALQGGISVGLLAGQVRSVPGIVGAFHLDLQPRWSGRWGISAGLGYRKQQFSGESRPIVPVQFADYYRATRNTDVIPDSLPANWAFFATTNRILVPVSRLHRIEAPLSLFWRPTHRWKLFAGAHLSRIVWVETADRGLFTYNSKIINNDNRQQPQLNSTVANILPAWETQWHTGLSFSPFKRLELGLLYRQIITYNQPNLAETSAQLLSACTTCGDTYPEAAKKSIRSLKPAGLQFNAVWKF